MGTANLTDSTTAYPHTDFVLWLDGQNCGTLTSLEALSNPGTVKGTGDRYWLHLAGRNAETIAQLEKAKLDSFLIDALTAEETRPRCSVHGDGAILNLRGININPGADPEDMISIRIWATENRIVSVGLRPLQAALDLRESLARSATPLTTGAMIARLALRLADHAEPAIAKLNEDIDDLEEEVLEEVATASRHRLAEVSRAAIVMRRYMFPQRDALSTLEIEDLTWLKTHERSQLREAAERVTRFAEELDAIRDRAQIVRDQISDIRAESMNRRMLVLSIAAAIFLPLGLVTGLLGINVGGVPGAESGWGFWIVCAILALIVVVQLWLFKKFKLF